MLSSLLLTCNRLYQCYVTVAVDFALAVPAATQSRIQDDGWGMVIEGHVCQFLCLQLFWCMCM